MDGWVVGYSKPDLVGEQRSPARLSVGDSGLVEGMANAVADSFCSAFPRAGSDHGRFDSREFVCVHTKLYAALFAADLFPTPNTLLPVDYGSLWSSQCFHGAADD